MASGVFLARHVVRDTEFTDSVGEKYIIRSGDRIAIYPPAMHKDKEIFEDPMVRIILYLYLLCLY